MNVDGIDIVLVLDASGSMQFADYGANQKNRFEVAKDEAIYFVEKRTNDAIGLVIFGNEAISRIPITHDKKMVVRMIKELQLGDIDANGTKLATAMLSAANRLKCSESKSKIMILLTDGTPSEGDNDPHRVIEIVKKLGIKVYTIGIGSEKEDYFMHPLYGMVAKPQVNKQLLDYIAQQTGGHSFMAHDVNDMRTIYDTIDALEKTEKVVPIFNHYYDLFWYCALCMVGLWIVEALLVTYCWIGL
jgi:Ca-activated chloride channel family protein